MYQLAATNQCACVVEPGVVVVEVSFGGVVSLVGDLVQLEHEGEVGHPPHLHLWRLGSVSVNSKEHINSRATRKHSSRMSTDRVVTRMSSERVATRPIVNRMTHTCENITFPCGR